MTQKDPEIELRQEELREILGIVPPWIVRWGTILIALVILVLLIGSVWFRYPDRISSQVVLTTMNPPVLFHARKSGRIQMLFVADGDSARKGDLLGILESSADYFDMLQLDSLVLGFRMDPGMIKEQTDNILLPDSFNLGEWQTPYSSALRSLQEWSDYSSQGSHLARISSLKKQLADFRVLYNRQYRIRQLRSEELVLEEEQYQRIAQLKDSGALARIELDKAKSSLLRARGEVEAARTQLSQTQIDMDRLEYNIISEEKDFVQNRDQRFNSIKQDIEKLAGAISDWKLNYSFISPVDGIVSFNKVWSVNQQVVQGERIMVIVNGDEGQVIGKLLLPAKGAGKVKAGHLVVLRIDKYPYMQYGLVKGKVERISLVPDAEHYSVEISLPEGFKSTYHQELEFSQSMTGQAQIITDNMSLLVRILNPLKSLISRKYN